MLGLNRSPELGDGRLPPLDHGLCEPRTALDRSSG